jgi:hypothetical protein
MRLELTRVLGTLLVVAAAGAAGTAWAADPSGLNPQKPSGKPSATIPAATCASYNYACPSGVQCSVLRAPPPGMPPLTFSAYQCTYNPQLALLPGQCPPGFTKAPNGTCNATAPTACTKFVKPMWNWTGVAVKLPDGKGYTCPYNHASMQG